MSWGRVTLLRVVCAVAAILTAAATATAQDASIAGRVTDEGRDVYCRAYPTDAPSCQTFGLFRLSWPRPEVLAAATRRFAQRQISAWGAGWQKASNEIGERARTFPPDHREQ